MSESKSYQSGIGLPGLVFIVFLFLKLAGIGAVKDWSWWWVTSPIWLGAVIVLVAVVIALIYYVIKELIKK